jgi:hypothetical protein
VFIGRNPMWVEFDEGEQIRLGPQEFIYPLEYGSFVPFNIYTYDVDICWR